MTPPFDPRAAARDGGRRRPHLLVSVASASDARAALAGGADLIDAKDPGRGALGAVTLDLLRAIATEVGGTRPMSAALGDAVDAAPAERAARTFAEAGAGIVKVGLADVSSPARARALLDAAVRGARAGGGVVVAVAYADAATGLSPSALIRVAAGAGAAGVLLDTADKTGPALVDLVPLPSLRAWVTRAHATGLWAAVAGRLTVDAVSRVRDTGTDVLGVRGAACDGGRNGVVAADRVALLRTRLGVCPTITLALADRPRDRRPARSRSTRPADARV